MCLQFTIINSIYQQQIFLKIDHCLISTISTNFQIRRLYRINKLNKFNLLYYHIAFNAILTMRNLQSCLCYFVICLTSKFFFGFYLSSIKLIYDAICY